MVRRPTTTPRCSSRATRRRSRTRATPIAADQSVPDWDNTKAGTIFEQMYTKANGKFVGVDSRQRRSRRRRGRRCSSATARPARSRSTGQDATDEGLQRVLLGTQCMTVYKAIKKEADAAAALAIALAKGDTAGADAQATGTVDDTETKAQGQVRAAARRRRSSRRTSRTSSPTASPPPTSSAPPTRLKKACDEVRRQRMTDAVEGQQRAPLLSLRGINKSFGAVL